LRVDLGATCIDDCLILGMYGGVCWCEATVDGVVEGASEGFSGAVNTMRGRLQIRESGLLLSLSVVTLLWLSRWRMPDSVRHRATALAVITRVLLLVPGLTPLLWCRLLMAGRMRRGRCKGRRMLGRWWHRR